MKTEQGGASRLSAKKRVAVFLPLARSFNGFGGAERRIPHIFSHLDPSVFEVTVVVLAYANSAAVSAELSRYIDGDTRVIYTKGNFETFRLFVKERFDVVFYTDCVLRTVPVIWGAWLRGSKRVMMLESINNARYEFKRNWGKTFFSINIRMSNRLDCLYPSCVPFLAGKHPKKIITVTPSILPRLDTYLREEKKEKMILFAGRLQEQKNPRLFLETVIALRDELRGHQFRCQICGEGPLKEELVRMTRQSGCEDIVDIRGYVNMEQVTPVCSVFCSLQDKENYPSQSLLEAIACGCFCIASNRGDTGILVKEAFGGMVELEQTSLTAALLRTIRMNEEERDAASQAARRFARENFAVEKAAGHYEQMICTLLKR